MGGPEEVLARLRDAHKAYGKVKALDGVDLPLRSGEQSALLAAWRLHRYG